MKKSFQIFKRDLGRLFRNRAAVLILVGISVLPSFYAWFNIAANMDPYGNTKGIQVAIANEDKGADSEQMSLDAGQNIVDNLKKNDQLGWKFVDAKEAKKGVRSGKYYAAIVIPDNFSESLLSILSGDIKQPKLDYYINEKKNAIEYIEKLRELNICVILGCRRNYYGRIFQKVSFTEIYEIENWKEDQIEKYVKNIV